LYEERNSKKLLKIFAFTITVLSIRSMPAEGILPSKEEASKPMVTTTDNIGALKNRNEMTAKNLFEKYGKSCVANLEKQIGSFQNRQYSSMEPLEHAKEEIL
jgi:hypothetical protein